jgi:hypothetical protein
VGVTERGADQEGREDEKEVIEREAERLTKSEKEVDEEGKG